MIPRIIHQFWDKPELPDSVATRVASWREMHPGWAHFMWNDFSAASFIEAHFGSDAVRCFHACTLPSMRSDVLRIAAAGVIGGAYVDADALCLRPVDALSDRNECVLNYVQKSSRHVHTNFFLVAPGHFFFRRLWDQLVRNITDNADNAVLGVSALTGPGLFQTVWRGTTKAERAGIHLLERSTLAPYLQFSRIEDDAPHWSTQRHLQPIIDFARADGVGAE